MVTRPETSFKSRLQGILVDLVFPGVVFVLVGMFGWRIRGVIGFGAVPGCIYAGSLFGMLWFILSKEKTTEKTRRFSTGWSFSGIAAGIGISGMHAWMQWRPWIQGTLVLGGSAPTLSISPVYGYVWLFICAAPWLGMGAVFLAWTNNEISLSSKDWILRFISGGIGAAVAIVVWWLLKGVIVPRYAEVMYYMDTDCPSCDDATGDTFESLIWMGIYLGFLCFEIGKRHWVNVKMITLCGLMAGFGWVLLQAWFFDPRVFPEVPRIFVDELGFYWSWFELWAGFPFGLALSISYYAWNRPKRNKENGEVLFRTPPSSNTLKKGGRNAEPIFAIDMVVGIGLVFNMHSTAEGLVAMETGTRPDFVPEVAIPALVAVAIAIIVHVIILYRNPYRAKKAEENISLRDNTRYCTIIFPIFFLFTLLLGMLVTIRGEILLQDFISLFYVYQSLIFLVISIALLIAWWFLRKKLQDHHQLLDKSSS